MKQTELQERLQQLAQKEYQEFSSGLLPGVKNMLGIRLPELRKIAKEMAAEENWAEYLSWRDCRFFEEVMLQGMILGYVKAPLQEILQQTEQFIPRIDNWSVNDSFCTTFSSADRYPKEVWEFLMQYQNSRKEFEVRVVAVMSLAHYLHPDYIESVLTILGKLDTSAYYASMAVTWAYATAWAKFPERTRRFLEENPLDRATHKRMLQKGIESRRITGEDKEWMRKERAKCKLR